MFRTNFKTDFEFSDKHKLILSYLDRGEENAISRKHLSAFTGLPDRQVRYLIADLRLKFPILSNSLTGGYYLPSAGLKGDRECLSFMREQRSRARKINKSLMGIYKELNSRELAEEYERYDDLFRW